MATIRITKIKKLLQSIYIMNSCMICSFNIRQEMIFCPGCGSNLNIQKIQETEDNRKSAVISTSQLSKYHSIKKRLVKLEAIDQEYIRQQNHFWALSQAYQDHLEKFTTMKDELNSKKKQLRDLNKISILSIKALIKGNRRRKQSQLQQDIDLQEERYGKEKRTHENLLERVKLAEEQLNGVKKLKEEKIRLNKKLYQLMQDINFDQRYDNQLEMKITTLTEQLEPLQNEFVKLEALKEFVEITVIHLRKSNQFRKEVGIPKKGRRGLIDNNLLQSDLNLRLLKSELEKAGSTFYEGYNHYPNFPKIHEIIENTGGDFFNYIFGAQFNKFIKNKNFSENLTKSLISLTSNVEHLLVSISKQYSQIKSEKQKLEEKISLVKKELAQVRIQLLEERKAAMN